MRNMHTWESMHFHKVWKFVILMLIISFYTYKYNPQDVLLYMYVCRKSFIHPNSRDGIDNAHAHQELVSTICRTCFFPIHVSRFDCCRT